MRPVRALVALAALVSTSSFALATTVERVVAVIGDQPVLLSDVRARARPFLLQIEGRARSGAERAAAESELYKQVLERIVDDRLEQEAAVRAHLTVTSDEIDAGLKNVASQQSLTVEQIIDEAKRQGLTVQEYRDEIRRQILEGKLLQLRVRGRVRVTEEDVRATYQRIVKTERKRLDYRAAWIVVRIPPGASEDEQRARATLASRLAQTAAAGRDAAGNPVTFEQLARAYSDDAGTRSKGGDLGQRKMGDLAQPIEDEVTKLDAGAVGGPFRFKDTWVVLTVVSRDESQVPPLDKVHEDVAQRAYSEQMDRARRQWLDELRRSAHIDVRL